MLIIIIHMILLDQCISTRADTCKIDWNILTIPIKLGKTVQLECDVKDENLCPGTPRWEGGPEHQIISIGNTVFDKNKYEISSSPGKYTLTILSIMKEHLNSQFVCHVRFSKHGEILKDKKPVYSLKVEKPKLMENARIFANISAVPVNNTYGRYFWSRHPVDKSNEDENLSNKDKFLEKEEDDGLSLTIKNVTTGDVNMIYKLNYSDTVFIANVRLENTSMETDGKNDSKTHDGEGRFHGGSPVMAVVIVPVIVVGGIGIMVYVYTRSKKQTVFESTLQEQEKYSSKEHEQNTERVEVTTNLMSNHQRKQSLTKI
ncbi:unnamed protein product [Mytilus coruscus]|uniref:Ig-like domain-containing protein n=1 Tax=Mytilus coruscus TaxID=42192 RepID=A0A6J8EIS1_MYTCO|nr:unnamed protein product [Mytilus coruscus]